MVCDRATVLCRVLPHELVALIMQHAAAMTIQCLARCALLEMRRKRNVEWAEHAVLHIESFAHGREPVALGVPPWERRAVGASSMGA